LTPLPAERWTDNKIAGLAFLSINERITGVFGKRQGPLRFEKTGELIDLTEKWEHLKPVLPER